MTDRLLTAREVAERLGVFPGTVLRWVRRGELPAIRLPGGALRFSERALDEWLAARTVGADTVPNVNGRAALSTPPPDRNRMEVPMSNIETHMAVARALTAMAEVMSPEQRREAADKLRGLSGDDLTRKLFADFADELEKYNARTS
jgi:excisionase family DNA binding protein